MKTSIGIKFIFRQFALSIIVLLFLNIFLLLGTALSNELRSVQKSPASKFILNQFNLAFENVVGAWYSSMLLLLVAIAALLCFFIDRQQKKSNFSGALDFSWLLFCLIFLTLSLDEMGSFHELIGESTLFRKIGFGEGAGWNTFFLLLFLVAFYMITFFVSKIKTSRRSFVFLMIGTLLFLSNPIQEAIEISDYRSAADPNSWKRPTLLLLMEEGSEVFGMLCFLTAMVLYAFDRSKQLGLSKTGVHLILVIKRSTLIGYTALLATLLFTNMTLLYLNANRIVKGDDGIAENWFPSACFFFVALIAFYTALNSKLQNKKRGYWLLASLALLQSAYFGSNMYASELVYQPVISRISPYHLLLLLILCLGSILFFLFYHKTSKLLVLGFMMITLSQFFSSFVPSPFTGYISALFLLGALLIENLSPYREAFQFTPTAMHA